MILWDLLPTSGASQVHLHINAYLIPDRYSGNSLTSYDLIFMCVCVSLTQLWSDLF